MTRDYELGIILNPEVSEEQTQAILSRVEQVVTNHSGQIVRVNQWGRRRLAYPIERHRDGLYIFIDMILTPETVTELERTLKVSEEVLRHMMKRRDPKTIQKEREEREEREARAAAAAAAPASTTGEGATAEETAGEAQEEAMPVPVGEETDDTGNVDIEQPEPVVLADDELAEVPPAIEESEGVEA